MSSISDFKRKELQQNSLYSEITCLANQVVEKTKELWTQAISTYINYLDHNDATKFKPHAIQRNKFSILDPTKIQDELHKVGTISAENTLNQMDRTYIKDRVTYAVLGIFGAALSIGDCLFPKSPMSAFPFAPLILAVGFYAIAVRQRLDYKAEDRQKIEESHSTHFSLLSCQVAAEDKQFVEFAKKEYTNLELSPSAWAALYREFQRNQ